MKRYLFLSILVVTVMATAMADVPVGYYNSLNGKKNVALKTAVRDIIYNHTEVSSYQDLPRYFRHTDARPGTNQWWEMYSNETFYLSSFSGLNREHSVPKSWWGGSTSIPPYTDLNHLYPSESDANTAKSNYPLGMVMTATFDNGVSKVGYAVTGQGGGAAKVFEPADEYKGDFARTYFYMATCYAGYVTWKYQYMFQNTSDLTLNQWSQTLLLKWHREDPVSQKEIDRNEAVYGFQNNRNPFIDFPDLAEYIWGNKKGQTFSTALPETPTGEVNLITPTQDMELDFGQVAIGNTVKRQLFFKGENMDGSLTLTLWKDDSEMFKLDDEEIKASLVNAESGYWLNITYAPTALGDHSTRLVISDGGLVGSRGIALTGSCLAVPSLSVLTALEPTDITENSYTANWEASTDEIDYYIVTRTQYVDGAVASSEEIETEENSVEIIDFDESTRETYSVQSVRLGYRSAMSNIITVDHAGISGVEMDMPLGTAYYPGGVRFVCGIDHTNGRVYDTFGRVVMTLDVIYNNMEVSLPWGVYFVLTDQLTRPIQIIVK